MRYTFFFSFEANNKTYLGIVLFRD